MHPCYSFRHTSRVDVSQSLFLRTHRFSFIDGSTGVFDRTPIVSHYHLAPTPQNPDARAIASDFFITGND